MKLSNFLPNLVIQDDIDISNIMYNAQETVDNSIYFARIGLTHDGHNYISQAIDHGAKVIVYSREINRKKEGVQFIYDEHCNANFSKYVDLFYEKPSESINVIGVTGTSGKSNIAHYLNHLLFDSLISFKEDRADQENLVAYQDFLKKAYLDQYQQALFEVKSIELTQNRYQSIRFDCAIFTNLYSTNLDFHLNMESYYKAKKSLFTSLKQNSVAIINIDNKYGKRLFSEVPFASIISCSFKEPAAHYYIKKVTYYKNSTNFTLVLDEHEYDFTTNVIGHVNLMYLLLSIACARYYGVAIDTLQQRVGTIPLLKEHYQIISCKNEFDIIIDQAKSYEEIQNLISFISRFRKQNSRIICVVGNIENNNPTQRFKLGELLDKTCDVILLTESKYDLIQIEKGIVLHPYIETSHYQTAIQQAIQIALKHDIILIIGKNENSQAIVNQEIKELENLYE